MPDTRSDDRRLYQALQLAYWTLVGVEGMHEDADEALEILHNLLVRMWHPDGTPRDMP